MSIHELTESVFDILRPDSSQAPVASAALNAALRSQMASAATAQQMPELAAAIEAMPDIDLANAGAMSLHALVATSAALPEDPEQAAAIKAQMDKLSRKTTVSELLGLTEPAALNPILAPQINRAALSGLLATSPALSALPALIDDFVERYAAASGSLADFWTSLAQDPQLGTAVPELQLSLQLGALTLDDAAMVAALRARLPAMTSPRDLAELSVADIEALIVSNGIAIPAILRGVPADAAAASYASFIHDTLTAAYPSAYFLQDLRGALAQSEAAADRNILAFLKNATGFDILHSNLARYDTGAESSVLAGIPPSERTIVIHQLAQWQRLARIQPDYRLASALLDQGFTSAGAIAKVARGSFLNRMTGPLGSLQQAIAIYERAQHIAARKNMLYLNVRQALGMNATRAIGDVGGVLKNILGLGAQTGQAPLPGLANWQTLFGGTSSCACSDCRSIYSAAAYFVDLMQYLQNAAPNAAGRTPYDVLISRRPDLPYIKLNCANTDVELPYVDLVNEILEGFVALQGHLDMSVAHDTPKDATPAELAVSPEYTNDIPYNTALFGTVNPPTLPYDRWLDTARVYLDFAGSSLSQVMSVCQTGLGAVAHSYSVPLAALPAGVQLPDFLLYDAAHQTLGLAGLMTPGAQAAFLALSPNATFQTAVNGLFTASLAEITRGTPTNLALACEALGISNAECIILTGSDVHGQPPASPATLADFYGDPASLNGVWNVVGFIETLQIGYDDLVQLLGTRFLNPHQTIVIQAPPEAPCDIDQMTLIDMSVSGGLLQNVTLDRMHRFVRLWKKLGWPIASLDKTITALQVADIDQGFLLSLAAVAQLQSTLGLAIPQVLSFWSDLDTDGKDSLYLTLFQNKAVFKPVDPAFTLRYFSFLAGLPTLDFPSPRFPNLTYDASAQLLLMAGSFTAAEYQALADLSSDPAYRTAVSTSTGLGYAFAPLAALPQVSPIWLNSLGLYYGGITAPMMLYVGAMPDDVRDQFNVSSDPAYQTAIDNIYAQRSLFGVELVGDAAAPGLSDHLPALLAALRLTAQDLALLRAYTGLADEV